MAEGNQLFNVKIITPDREFYQGQVSMIELNTVEGELGIYKNHIPLTTVLAPGVVTLTEENQKKKAAIHSGFVEILQDEVVVLAELAEWPEEIDEERARKALERAEERLNGHKQGIDVARAELAMKKALVRLHTKG